ncbi:MAG: GNAT family N-acetyltransferase [Planctomycetaceae bacterium]|jgi:GNAT superfamily N-acetyltransferase|nr:GNAT family N-acetyltransferase [Planctomycetaceae bacterium]
MRFIVTKIIRKINFYLFLLCSGQIFVLFQAIFEVLIPSFFLSMNKHIFYNLESGDQTNLADIDEVTIEIGVLDDVAKLVSDLYSGDSEALRFYEDYYREGVKPCIAWRGGKAIGVVWIYTGYYLANWEGYDAWLLKIGIEPQAKFFANGFIAPEYRGQKIFRKIIEYCTKIYCNDKFYSCVDEINITSVKAHERIGFRRCAVAYYIRFFRAAYCIFWIRNNKKYWNYSRYKLQRKQPVPISIITNS